MSVGDELGTDARSLEVVGNQSLLKVASYSCNHGACVVNIPTNPILMT